MTLSHKIIFVGIIFLSFNHVWSQEGQINIDRVDQMPDLPQPYIMRDWKTVARQYDEFVFDLTLTGEHLPLVSLKSSGVNYPTLQPILLDTYVGTNSSAQAEAINILPALIGASLIGLDKASQDGIDWVEKTKDFFNLKNGQLVYLNGYNTSSGNDWWYDLMPNIFFYQLTTLYNDEDYEAQFASVADQWLKAVNVMGAGTTPWSVPNMNYRAWRLSTMTGNASGVHEPEAAGAIAWILYHAYVRTNEEKYLLGAQHALEFLTSLSSNPSYELQLPYGALTAAKLNATLGAGYDIDKIINWCFERGPLRGWGTIVGTWDGQDVSGLIGEANDNGNDYAFMMNGYQQAAALAPLIKYDKRYARAISKWILNLANASRLFYPKYLASNKQDDYAWSATHDPQSVIAYEALKENLDGQALFGTGDAKRNGWAATNLGLYGSSHVGYLASIVDTTDVDGILKLDLNATDFFGDNRYPSYALFNPYSSDKEISFDVGAEPVDIYDAVSEGMLKTSVSGEQLFTIKAGEVIVITLLDANVETHIENNRLVSGDFIIDYHVGYDFDSTFRIKSLSAERTDYEFNETAHIYATVDNAQGDISYAWFVDGDPITTSTTGELEWSIPAAEGTHTISVTVTANGETRNAALDLNIFENIPAPPSINAITAQEEFFYEGDEVILICEVANAANENFIYQWEVNGGSFTQDDSVIYWSTPAEGIYSISCTVTNDAGLSSAATIAVLVKNNTRPAVEPMAYYPLNLNTNDYSGNEYHATSSGAHETDDAQGIENFAYSITTSDDIIYVPNAPSLNFTEAITIACWIKISPTGREAFVISHGSWEERWKISLTPDRKIRWTIKTSSGVVDLDSKDPVNANQFYHITASYSGYSLELYIDGVLDNFSSHEGAILMTDDAITFGQKSLAATQYFLNGTIDEVKIFNEALQPWQIEDLKTLWIDEYPTAVTGELDNLVAYPNPVTKHIVRVNICADHNTRIRGIATGGQICELQYEKSDDHIDVVLDETMHGFLILELSTTAGIKRFKLFIP